MGIRHYWKSITGTASGIVAIAGAFVVFDIEFPRPAWASEIKQLSGYVLELDSKITSQQLDETKLSLYRNIREREGYKTRNENVPLFLNKERILLERKIDDLESHLDYLRGKD